LELIYMSEFFKKAEIAWATPAELFEKLTSVN